MIKVNYKIVDIPINGEEFLSDFSDWLKWNSEIIVHLEKLNDSDGRVEIICDIDTDLNVSQFAKRFISWLEKDNDWIGNGFISEVDNE